MKCIASVTMWVVLMIKCTGGAKTANNCPDEEFLTATEYHQNLTSPGYPGQYTRPAACKWIITSNKDDGIIVFQVLLFNIESSQFCYRDQLTILDGRWRASPQLAGWCGTKSRGTQVKTMGSVAMVTFQALTQGSGYPGFILQYWHTGNGKLPEGDIQYSTANIILGVVFGLILILIFITLIVLVFIRNVRYNAQRRLQHIRVYS